MTWRVLGTCGICNGAVVTPSTWAGTVAPVPICLNCNSTMKTPYGPILTMDDRREPRKPINLSITNPPQGFYKL